MRHNPARIPAGSQRGWAILEAILASALLAIIVIAVYKTILSTHDVATQEHSEVPSALKDLQAAIEGYAELNSKLPEPDQAVVSTAYPGYLEGWMPQSLTPDVGVGRVRYLVRTALTEAPSLLYKPVPDALSTGLFDSRTTANNLDRCLAMYREERSGTGLPNGLRAAFVLQHVATTGNEGGGQSASTVNFQGDPHLLRAVGIVELIGQHKCAERISKVASMAKAALSIRDAGLLADQVLEVKESELADVELLHKFEKVWLATWTILTASYSMSLGVAIMDAEEGPAGAAKLIAEIGAYIFAIEASAQAAKSYADGMKETEEAIAELKEMIATMKESREALRHTLEETVNRTKELLLSGDLP